MIKSILAAALLFVLAVSGASANDPVATFLLESGMLYKNVRFTVDLDREIAMLNQDGYYQKVKFKEIVSITDSKGIDITESVINGWPLLQEGESPESDSTGHSEKVAPAPLPVDNTFDIQDDSRSTRNDDYFMALHQKSWNACVAVKPIYSFPFGDYYDGLTSGFGYEADLKVAITAEYALTFSFAQVGMTIDDRLSIYSLDPDIHILEEDISLTVFRYMLGLEWYGLKPRADSAKEMWYLYSTIGAISHQTKIDVVAEQISTGEVAGGSGKDTDTRFAMGTGGGHVHPIARNISFNIEANMDFVWTKAYYVDDPSHETYAVKGFIFELRAGLITYF